MTEVTGTRSNIASELQLLYELALSTGDAHDVEENCRRFVSVLLARKRLAFASVWLLDSQNQPKNSVPGYRLAYAKPRVRALFDWLPASHPSFEILGAGVCVSVSGSDPEFDAMVAETGIMDGAYALFALGNIGMLKLYSQVQKPFSGRELNQLRNVVEKFSIGLEGALAHERLRAEMRRREELEVHLIHAQKLRAIDNLTAGVAHDFNNILAVVLGFSELGSRNSAQDASRIQYYFDQIQTAGERGRDLVKQLLTFTQGGGSTPALVDLAQAMEESLRLLKGALPPSIEIVTKPVPALPKAYLELGQIQQMLMNLCINASDSMQGRGRIQISVRALSEVQGHCDSCGERLHGDFIELSVTDSGAGLDKDVLPWIFDPFFTTKPIGQGTGLGLSVVHGILHKYGGHIQARNSSSGGAHFAVLLRPIFATLAAPQANETPVQPVSAAINILVVDDEPTVSAFLKELLTLEGFSVETVGGSRAAFQMIEAEPSHYDLVITDQTMPGMSGEDLVLALRAAAPELPIVLCTGHASASLDPKLATLERFVYVGKPFAPTRLLSVISELLAD